jgi:hypothetical protein
VKRNAAFGCDFNRSMQHLDSITRAGGVADEEEKVFHSARDGRGLGRLGERSVAGLIVTAVAVVIEPTRPMRPPGNARTDPIPVNWHRTLRQRALWPGS